MMRKLLGALLVAALSVGCGNATAREGNKADDNKKADGSDGSEACPEKWKNLYNTEALGDEAAALEEAAQKYGISTATLDTTEPMPNACVPYKNEYDALQTANAASAAQIEAAQKEDPSVTVYEIDKIVVVKCSTDGQTLSPPPRCIGQDSGIHHHGGQGPRFSVKISVCEPFTCFIGETLTDYIAWTIGTKN